MSWLERRFEGRAQDAEQEQLRLLRNLVERHPAGILVVGDDGRVLAASATFRELFCQAPAPTNAPPLDPAVWSTDPARFRRRVAHIVSERREVASEEILLADGRAFERDYARLELPGGAAGHMWEYRDVSERRRAEQSRRQAGARLQFLVSAGAAVLYSCRPRPDYDRTYVSDNVAELLGYAPSRWTDDGFWRRALHPEDAARVMTEMPRLYDRGCQAMEYRLLHRDGHALWVHDEQRLVCEPEGQPVEIVGCMLDITARRHSESDFTTLGRATADVVHDFNNCLLVITGHTYLLTAAQLPSEALRESVEQIAKAAERAGALTERVRAMYKRREPPAVLPAAPPSPRGGETILVVENEDAVRVFAGHALTGSGYNVLEARRAEEALEIIAQHPGLISALLTDVSMPGMSGGELAKHLAAAQPGIKVIFMSGYDVDDPVVRPFVTPLSFLQKPFTPDVLALKLRQVLDSN